MEIYKWKSIKGNVLLFIGMPIIMKFQKCIAGSFCELLHVSLLESLHGDLELKYGTQKIKEQSDNVLFCYEAEQLILKTVGNKFI